MAPRWRGQRGRQEVWYTTLTDPSTGTGVWLHHELIAPSDGEAAYAHGLVAVFPSGGAPLYRRFGPVEWSPSSAAAFTAGLVGVTEERLSGQADGLTWDLRMTSAEPPLFTFPAWAWHRELLPAAQIVSAPGARYRGVVRYDGHEVTMVDALGATARIYGRGNAKRWAWLHADLGDGDVLEVVAAVSTQLGMRRIRPLPLVRLRVDGKEHPRGDTLLAARRLRADIGLPVWRVHGRIHDHQIDVVVRQPPEQTITVSYPNPDGTQTICHNSERATTEVTWSTTDGRIERRWHLAATAHAEVGGSPDEWKSWRID
jgi:hypothetical protein